MTGGAEDRQSLSVLGCDRVRDRLSHSSDRGEVSAQAAIEADENRSGPRPARAGVVQRPSASKTNQSQTSVVCERERE